MANLRVGLIGCGNISGIYLKNAPAFGHVDIVACADLDAARAKARAEEFGVPRACSVEELLADPEIDAVLNLTVPLAHASVCLAAIEAGKHVYVEKPLAVNRDDGRRVLDAALAQGVRVGCAPDTFLGGGLQTCRKLIDDGDIGHPVAATAFMLCHGHEHWHPDPAFFYRAGGGPMFDMGPYYLTALVSLLGPIARVTGSAHATFPRRTIFSQPKSGATIDVEVPTHIAGILDFANGAIATIVTSFDVWSANVPRIEIYGSEGTLSAPDPNTFGGPVLVRRGRAPEWEEVPLGHGYTENSRGLGLSDMAAAIHENRPHRASGDLAFHVLDVMEGIHDASRDGRHYMPESSVDSPSALTPSSL